MGHTTREHASLARAGARHDQQGCAAVLNGCALGVVEIVNERRSHLGIVGNRPDSWFRQSQRRRSQLPDVTNDLDGHSRSR
jgi:hypothetical protein